MHHYLLNYLSRKIMLTRDLEEFGKNLVPGRRLMGLDIGRKNIGVAISDRDWNYATPELVLPRKNIERDTVAIKNCLEQNLVCGIVCGIALGKNGEETRGSLFTENFAKILDKNLHLPIYESNEYLSSFAAEEFLISEMSSKYRKTRKIVDKVAASYILQDALDLLRELR
jgi:putative Holliday junction resolvase